MAGFLAGLLSPALTVATQAAGAYEGAEANAATSKQNAVMQAIALQRQQHEQELKDALTRAQTGLAGARTDRINNPLPEFDLKDAVDANGKPIIARFDKHTGVATPTGLAGKPFDPVMGSPEWIRAQQERAKADNIFGYHAPVQDHFTFPVAMGPDGKPTVFRANTRTGELASTGTPAKPTGTGGGGGGQGSQTSVDDMEQRYNEIASHANALASGAWQITPSMQAREGLTYGIARDNAAGKTPWRKQIEASGMDLLGMGSGPDFSRYQALMNSTRALGDDVAKVFKGRQNEEAVLREVALAQLTPDDYKNTAVVQQKLSRLRNVIDLARHVYGAQASGGAPSTAPTGTSHPSLTPAQQARAQSDPTYAAFLRSKGLM